LRHFRKGTTLAKCLGNNIGQQVEAARSDTEEKFTK